jgi:hypothetical protein
MNKEQALSIAMEALNGIYETVTEEEVSWTTQIKEVRKTASAAIENIKELMEENE